MTTRRLPADPLSHDDIAGLATALFVALFLIISLTGLVLAFRSASPQTAVSTCRSTTEADRTRTITLNEDLLSAQQIAHHLHWDGDWRDLQIDIEHLNPGLNWGRLQYGMTIKVPDTSGTGVPACDPAVNDNPRQQGARQGGPTDSEPSARPTFLGQER